MSTAATQLQRTPLFDEHVAAGGRIVPFAGWELPVQYAGVIAEHTAVRTSAGVFDVSHMGEVLVEGDRAEQFLQWVLSNDISKLGDGDAQYTLLMNETGGIDDDLIAYRLAPTRYLLVVNAANVATDVERLTTAAAEFEGVSVTDTSADWAMLAVQGPRALEQVAAATGVDLTNVDAFQVREVELGGRAGLAATTGYTGERGCELLIDPQSAPLVWRDLLSAGVEPCGLGARDTLRLEVCYPLHGNDIGPEINPMSARLSWVCALGTGFVGEVHVAAAKREGSPRKLVPVRATERGIPRPGLAVCDHTGVDVGRLTSGTMSPTLGEGIALAYLDSSQAQPGTELVVDVRGRDLSIEVVNGPFVKI